MLWYVVLILSKFMAKKSIVARSKRKQKFSTRKTNRCINPVDPTTNRVCGRAHGVMREFGLCRICFREEARKGNIPGVKKASW